MSRSQRVLVVDDDAVARGVTQQVLEQAGYEVIPAESGADALAFLARERPSLVLLDLKMADMDGYEVLSMIELQPALQGVPIVVISGQPPSSMPGSVPNLRKPVRMEELLAAVRQHAA
jgi:CheY-like chemotaxis protein